MRNLVWYRAIACRQEFDEFIENQGDNSQPLETTIGDNTNEFDPTIIDIFEPEVDPFDVEKFGEKDYNNDFEPNLDGYELDDTIRIEPTRDFENDFSDLPSYIFESSDGLTAAQRKRIERIDNTIKNHAKPHDFEGVRKELDGIDTGFDHITEMTEASRGLEKHIQGLEGSLRNPNLEPNVRKKLENARDRGIDTLNKMRDTLRGE